MDYPFSRSTADAGQFSYGDSFDFTQSNLSEKENGVELVYFLLPAAVFLGLIGLWGFFWAIRKGQYEDLDTPARRILFEDEENKKEGVNDCKESYSNTEN